MHSEHLVTVEKLAVGGDGVARIPIKDRTMVVFVSKAAPQDELKIKISVVEKTFLRAEIVEIIKPSPARREAPCEYFSACGGCVWQHINEDEQLRQKELILTELFKKFIPEVNYALAKGVASPKNLHYRNRIQLKRLGAKLGYFKKESHDIVDINYCLIADKLVSDQIPIIKEKLKPAAELQKYELKLNHKNEFEYYRIGESGEGLSFSQVNNEINQLLVELVTKLVADKNPSFLTELYAGAGNFTFDLLKNLNSLRIESVEMNPELTKFSTKKLSELSLQKRLFAFTSDCESFASRRALSNEFILLDPPRAGCSDSVLKKVIEAGSKDIIYISCHPVFLARDLQKIFAANKNYKIRHLQIFDMFPQTDHFETFVHLSTT
ncbi:MAG: class I SAM-dependent RNA methyltransferase [Bdellovibrio sp.]|nr:class I SAM-dependent RNA methyltransferase [Bdellovibrio sp.]